MSGPVRVYVTGADGMLGAALVRALAEEPGVRHEVCGVSLSDFDIADRHAVEKSVAGFAPHVVVHTAANAIVDECQADPARAIEVNVGGTRHIAAAARQVDARLIYISTDYVFDGVAPPTGGYRVTDLACPLNVYGLTKLAGETIARQLTDHLVVRTSWLFGGQDERTDQVLALLRRAARGRPTRLIDDQFSAPTYTVDLARALVALIGTDVRGIAHVVNRGRASWFDVGTFALGGNALIQPVSVAGQGFVAPRPRDSTLDAGGTAGLGVEMPSWQDAVGRFRETPAVMVRPRLA